MKRVRVPVQLCDFCGKYFCDEHIQPKVPQYSVQNERERSRWGDTKTPGHPCPPYMEIIKTREEERRARTHETLKKMDGEKAIPDSVKSWEGAAAYSEQTTGKPPEGEAERIRKTIQKMVPPTSQKTSEKPSELLPTHSAKKKAAKLPLTLPPHLTKKLSLIHISEPTRPY